MTKLLLGIGLAAMLACAQEISPKAEIFGGYQYTRIGIAPGINANGWNAAVTGNLNRWAGLTADFSGGYRDIAESKLRAHTYTFGPTFFARGRYATPFCHALFGGFRGSAGAGPFSAALNGFTMMIGGGVDVYITPRVAVRAGQLDWLLWRAAGMMEKQNARFSAGLVFRIN
ncbi:MAG: hypothetical protein ACM336_10000 [Acidobacteriota bacterium]